ncbi:MAG: hypothetical protein HKN17_07945 [Rhodothermales bacterium]|nr:hypothetical protein [Rhodothermales bacterium]
MRDRVGADIHLLVTTERTGGGGRSYQMQFIGQGTFADLTETLTYASSSTDTENERRAGYTRLIEQGLFRFLLRTRLADRLDVIVEENGDEDEEPRAPEDDPWNFWVFNVGVDGSYEAESSRDRYEIETDLSANRVTEEWKIQFFGGMEFSEANFDVDEGTITNRQRNGRIFGTVVNSLSDHWSAGFTTFSNTSTRSNTDFSASISPTVEYNVFPYSESSTRAILFRYEMNFRYFDYDELTIFEKTEEQVIQHQLSVRADFEQPWGSARVRLTGEQFITDYSDTMFDLYNVRLSGFLYFRLLRGLTLDVGGEISSINDQIFLPAEDASDTDVLLGRRSLPTDFEYDISMGFSYRFGSIFNNVVNPRFDF